MSYTDLQVAQACLRNMWTNGWNHDALTNTSHGYVTGPGGVYINWRDTINWSSYSIWTEVNQATPHEEQMTAGFTQHGNHDPQCCAQYFTASALYLQNSGDTSFTGSNPQGHMGLSDMCDHLTQNDYAVAPANAAAPPDRGYNRPKGEWCFSLLHAWQALQPYPYLSQKQKDQLQQSVLYQAWQFMHNWLIPSMPLFCDPSKMLCESHQSLYMAAAVAWCAKNWPTLITPTMFANASSNDTPAIWLTTAVSAARRVLTRGAYNTTYQLLYDEMAVKPTSSSDTPTGTVAKLGNICQATHPLGFLYQLTNDATFLTAMKNILDGTYLHGCWESTYGGWISNIDMATGTVSSSKETRAISHGLYGLHLYNEITNNSAPDYVHREAAARNVLTTMFSPTGGGGFVYIYAPSLIGRIDNYSHFYTSTLTAAAKPGDKTIKVGMSTPHGTKQFLTPNDSLIIDEGKINEEELVFNIPDASHVLTINPKNQKGSGLAFAHAVGAVITDMNYPELHDTHYYTTEAMSAAVAWSMLSYSSGVVPGPVPTVKDVVSRLVMAGVIPPVPVPHTVIEEIHTRFVQSAPLPPPPPASIPAQLRAIAAQLQDLANHLEQGSGVQ